MDKVKKVYVDSRFRTNDSVSDSDFKFELKESLELPDNTVCFVDDISIPHSWRTIESHNNKLYIVLKTAYLVMDGAEGRAEYNYDAYVLEIPEGNYTGISLAATIQETLSFATAFEFEVIYNASRGSITIQTTISSGINSNNSFIVKSDSGVVAWSNATPWKDKYGNMTSVYIDNLQSINGILRNTVISLTATNLETDFYRSYESGFLDLLNIHNIYIHCPNLGHFNSIGVRGENSIIKKVPVSSSFGYLILDSVVSPHDKMDVSRQTIGTIHITLKDVYGNVLNLHGANCSLSLVFVTSD